MRTLASAARLLAGCTSAGDTGPLMAGIGFTSDLVPLSRDSMKLLGLPDFLEHCHIVAGAGALRAIAFEIPAHCDERSTLTRTATCLSARAPQLLFLLAAVHRDRHTLSIAAFESTRIKVRVSALVVRLDRVVDSDAETLCALGASSCDSDLLTHCRWTEILGRESIGRSFFQALERVIETLSRSLSPGLPHSEASELALLYVSRLLFLSFLETKGWMNGDHAFLSNQFARCMLNGGGYHLNVLRPLFFGTLNTPARNRAQRARQFGRIPFLNGGLFNKSMLETRTTASRFSDDALGDVFGDLLTRYRYTAREDGTTWTEAAVDPEMLGRAFEGLMSARHRKTSGAFYTPQSLVREVSRAALSYGLASKLVDHATVLEAMNGSIPSAAVRPALLNAIDRARILDPACGSGAFLVNMLEELAGLKTRLGDLRPPHAIRREVLTRSIFGVDIIPMAVWLCELRLWLAMAIEDPETDPTRVAPLPNLDRNIRVGDSLSGDAFGAARIPGTGTRLSALRARYSRATGPGKKSLARMLEALERKSAVSAIQERVRRLDHDRRELLIMARSTDLFGERLPAASELTARLLAIKREIRAARRESRRLADGAALPFSFPAVFADVASDGGFTVIAGNPPWVRTHNLDTVARSALRQRFQVYRNSAWTGGSVAAGAGRGFASQVDAAALFVERCTDLLKSGGTMSLILPAKLWRSLSGGGVRQLLLDRMSLRELHDLTNAPNVFEAAVYPSILTASRSSDRTFVAVSHRKGRIERWNASQKMISFDDSHGSPWVLAPPSVRANFEKVSASGVALAATCMGRALLGVKTGCNEAFIVAGDADVEPHLLRPVLRGDHIRQWSASSDGARIVWTHDARGPLRILPPAAERRLRKWRSQLERRTDAQRTNRWWSLFRTEGADSALPRVVWADIGKQPRAAVLEAGDASVPLNTCYVVRCHCSDDAHTLAAILNSRLAASWLALIAEPARGGYMRYMGWTMSLLPLPRDWARARKILVPLALEAARGRIPAPEHLVDAVLESYGLTWADVENLLAWSS